MKLIIDKIKEHAKTCNTTEELKKIDFLLNNGNVMKPHTMSLQEKDALLRTYKFYTPEHSCCYDNAIYLTSYSKGKYSYYEGYQLIEGGIPDLFQHAWNEHNGKIMDITFKLNKESLPEKLKKAGCKNIKESLENYKVVEYFGIKIPYCLEFNKNLLLVDINRDGLLSTYINNKDKWK